MSHYYKLGKKIKKKKFYTYVKLTITLMFTHYYNDK